MLDNDTSDGSTDGEGFVRIPVHRDSVDHAWMVETVRGSSMSCSTDTTRAGHRRGRDRRPRARVGHLGAYIDEFAEWFVNCIGYEILHLVDREEPYDPSRPILDQRGYWFANGAYNKPALASGPMAWLPGLHHRANGQVNPDPNLRLIHLHRMDFEVCRARHRGRRERAWNKPDLDESWAAYNRIAEGDEFESWFYGDSGFEEDGVHIGVERIPESWRGRF